MCKIWRVVVVILLVGTLLNPGDTIAQGPQPPGVEPGVTAQAFGSTPLLFIENVDQFPDGAANSAAPASCPPDPENCTPGWEVGRDFFIEVLERLADVPVSDFAVDALVIWEPYENTEACWNPLATTWTMEVVCNFICANPPQCTYYVQHYQDQTMGTQATARTLAQGYYDNIRRMLRLEEFNREGLRADLDVWGTCSVQGCNSLLDKWKILWNAQGFRVAWVHETDASPTCASVSFDGEYIAVGSADGLLLLDHDGNVLWSYQTEFPIVDVSMTSDARHIVAGGSRGYAFGGGRAYFFDLAGELNWTTTVARGISSVSLSPEGDYFAMVYEDSSGRWWYDIISLYGYNESEWLWYHSFGRYGTGAGSVSTDGKYTAVGGAGSVFGDDGGVRLYDKAGGLLWQYAIDTTTLGGDEYSVSISSDGAYLAAGNRGNDNLYSFGRDQELLWSHATGPVEGVSMSADGNYIVAASSDEIYLFDRHENLLERFQLNNIQDVSMSADADMIVAVTGDNKVYAYRSGIPTPDLHGEVAPSEMPSAPLPIPDEWARDEQFSRMCPTSLASLQDDYDASPAAPLTFNIDITRYYGATEEKEDVDGWINQTLIDRGTVDREAVLYLQVYDLDPSEVLEVSVNGHPLRDVIMLQSAGSDQWGDLRVEVPVEYLLFPTTPGAVGDCDESPDMPTPNPRANSIVVRPEPYGRKLAIGTATLCLRGVRPIVLVPGYSGAACQYEWHKGNDLEKQLQDVYGLITYRPCQESAHSGNEDEWHCFELVGDDPDHRSRGTLERNAKPLKWTVDKVKKRYGVDKVNLLGHSKGGLFMREYVEGSLKGYESVEHMIALDSVQMGVAIMDWALGRVTGGALLAPDRLVIWKGLEWFHFDSRAVATHELQEANISRFNSIRRDKSDQGVRYHSIIGYAGLPWDPAWFDPARWALNPEHWWSILFQLDFGLVAYEANLRMGEARGPSDPLLTCPSQRIGNIEGHSEQTCSLIEANHNEARNFTAAVEAVAKALGLNTRPEHNSLVQACDERTELQGASGGGGDVWNVEPLADTDSVHSFSFTGVLTYGQAVSLTVPVDGSHLEAYVGWDSDDGLSLELTDPAARQITSVVAAGDPNIDYDELRGEPGFGYAGYVITDTVEGPWTLHAAAPASGTGPDINWDVIVSQRSPLSCTLTVGQQEYMEGATVQLEARPVTGTETILGAQIIGQDEAPDGTLTAISLLDDGAHADDAADDGLYARQIVAAQPGMHRVATTATGILPSGIAYMRQSRAAYDVLPASAHFTGVYADAATDDDADGLYDSLVITSTVHLDRAGDYEVIGWLSTPSGQELSSDVATLSGNAGDTLDVPLWYDSEQLIEREGDGPFVLSRITLIDRSVDLQADSASDVYTTTSYSNLDFSGWEARLAGAIFDEGIDTTGTGGYDVLRVDVPLEVRRSGNYTVTVDLQTGPGATVGTYPASLVASTPGTYTVTVDYDGALIAAAGDDGHYVLRSLVVKGPLGVALSQDTAGETGYYAHTDFEADVTAPTSHILPVTEPVYPESAVDISWEGSDLEPGTGLVGFWLQYRVGSEGEWTDWVTYTTLTSLPFGPTEPVTLEAGETYYLQVQAHDIAGNVEPYPGGDGDAQFTVIAAPNSVTVTGPTTGTPDASYAFTATVSPITATSPITYVWQATGVSLVTHTGGTTDTVNLSWSSAGMKAITVTATNVGGTVTDTHTITITASTLGIPLSSGWNLISISRAPASTTIGDVLSSIEGHYDLVYAYDASNEANPWKKYNVVAQPWLNDLTDIDEAMGFWVRATEAVTLTVAGSVPSSMEVLLYAGWNLVGYPSHVTRPITEALASIEGKYDLVYGYDAWDAEHPWEKYNTGALPFLNDLTEMGPHRGYWIRVNEDCVWSVS